MPRVVEGFVGEAAPHRPVPDHGDDGEVVVVQVPAHGHPPGRGDRRGGVPGPEGVVLRFVPAQERGQTLVAADRGQLVVPTGENLVDVGLVPGVPDDLVPGRVEHVVERDGELGHPEAGPEVPYLLGDHVDVPVPDLLRELPELVLGEGSHVGGVPHGVQ